MGRRPADLFQAQALRREADTAVTLLRPTGRAGRIQATATTVFAPDANPTMVIWTVADSLGVSGGAGDEQGYEAMAQFVLPAEADFVFPDTTCRLVRGNWTGGDHNPEDEWTIDCIEDVPVHGDCVLKTLMLKKTRRGWNSDK